MLVVTRDVPNRALAGTPTDCTQCIALSPCPPIGHTERRFSVPVLPLATRREYSQSLSSHWPHGEKILSPCPPIGHTERIFLITRAVRVKVQQHLHPDRPIRAPVTAADDCCVADGPQVVSDFVEHAEQYDDKYTTHVLQTQAVASC
jgi:hypothetical protein